jgi:hypothetical protein
VLGYLLFTSPNMAKVSKRYPNYAPSMTKVHKVRLKYIQSKPKVRINFAQSIQNGRSDSNQVLSNSTFTRSNSRTSPYQALVCPKMIINRLIGRAASCTKYILVSYLYRIPCNFFFFIKNISLSFL